MEWNGKPPLQWEWENLITCNSKATENPKKFQLTALEIDFEEGINSESCYSSGGGGGGSGTGTGTGTGTGGSSSDLVLGFSSKSPTSASINSSSTGELKTSNFAFEAFEGIPKDPSQKKEYFDAKPTGTSPMLSIASGEPLLGLKLGKRTYFEDVSAGSSAKTSSLSTIPVSSVTPAKRSKANWQSSLDRYCQVEGCKLELSSAKDYHRKHRICESHSKCPKVIVDGMERRFCQQCSRFHGLSEFDDRKRSCRKRLSDHNARRRRPQKQTFRLNPAKLSLLPYDGRQQISPMWSSIPLVQSGSNTYFTWENPNDSNLVPTSEFLLKPAKEGNIHEQLHYPSHELPSSSITTLCPDSSRLFPFEAIKPVFHNQGLESINIPTLDETQDFHRALSLLSTNTWGSCEPKPISLHPVCKNHANMSQPVIPAMPQSLPLSSPEDWQIEPLSTKSQVQTLSSHADDNNHFQEFQLFNAPYDRGFYSSQLI